MPRRHRQLRVRDPDVFLLLPATPLAHRHARILRTIPVDLTIFSFRYPDLHHGLLATPFPIGFTTEWRSASDRNRVHLRPDSPDADKDGKISKQEWMKFMEAEFDRLDKDKSGDLDAKDLTQSKLRASHFVSVGK
jgi:hypothetical protein